MATLDMEREVRNNGVNNNGEFVDTSASDGRSTALLNLCGQEEDKYRPKLAHLPLLGKFDVKGPPQLGKGVEYGGVKELLTCAYNESHQVGYGQFARHLANCRQMATKEKLDSITICEFNALHHVNKDVYSYHLTVCPNRRQHEYQYAPVDLLSKVFQAPEMLPVPFYVEGKTPQSFPLVEKMKEKITRMKNEMKERREQRFKMEDQTAEKSKLEGIEYCVMKTKDKVSHWLEIEGNPSLYLGDEIGDDDDESLASDEEFEVEKTALELEFEEPLGEIPLAAPAPTLEDSEIVESGGCRSAYLRRSSLIEFKRPEPIIRQPTVLVPCSDHVDEDVNGFEPESESSNSISIHDDEYDENDDDAEKMNDVEGEIDQNGSDEAEVATQSIWSTDSSSIHL